MWYDDLVKKLPTDRPVIINDAKTPSGRVHVGSLRGVILHDAVAKVARAKGLDAHFLYTFDDLDAMDGLPSDAPEALKAQMGKPMSHIPAPDNSAPDLGRYYAQEFIEVIKNLGVELEIRFMSDVYRAGEMNASIDTLLNAQATIRDCYLKASKAERPADWYPLQVVCENCGKIGTTQVTGYDGEKVHYNCSKNHVSWATGCGHSGSVSPFDGRAKLPYKVEWSAKWQCFDVALEGAGKDHTTKGGSRDVADMICRRVFKAQPPVNMPYEFFLVAGSKMSSSKGIGSSAKDMADFLPAEILRFLILRTPPKRTVNFGTDAAYMIKLFNEYDQLVERYLNGKANEEQKSLLRLCSPDSKLPTALAPSFQLLMALCVMPHLDVQARLEAQLERPLNDAEQRVFERRLRAVHYWLAHFAEPGDIIHIQTTLSEAVINALDVEQKAYLIALRELLRANPAKGEAAYQTLLFDAARLSASSPATGFKAFYRAVLDREDGPKGGALLSFVDTTQIVALLEPLTLTLAVQGATLKQTKTALEKKIQHMGAIRTITALAYPTEDVLYLEVLGEDERIHRLFVDKASEDTTAWQDFIRTLN